ncbi:hypothetical protein GCM10007939_13460 [Amylibacter marinus]|uniref:Asl1-like glycosyl hydrolase catalytic domain-containing protein n=1 Tax=Amylibacter marinus TaxID=1475483 RepID=A0ABQ5VUD7_9RHOB|nr:hypothetical protein [Amylibacter marinus]GLQ35063.1 hypothetical protein GCM10007939_13460 [Amylibacter marinus]
MKKLIRYLSCAIVVGMASVVTGGANPIIGMGFPPVSQAAHRDFTIRALGNLDIEHIRIVENWRRRGMDPDFSPLVQRITHLNGAGIKVLLTVQSNGPNAACARRNAHSCLIREDAPFEDYLTGLLAAVGDHIEAIQFGNEWDNQFVGTSADFLNLHQRFSSVVRAERPELPIVLGGITGRAAYAQAACVEGVEVHIPNLEISAQVHKFCRKEAGRNARAQADVRHVLAHADFDAVDIHLYDTEDLWPAAVQWLTALSRGREVWVTEFGGPTPELEPKDPAYQSQRLRAYLDVIGRLPIKRAYYFKLLDDDGSIHKHSGLYDKRAKPKPALEIFSQYQR